MSTERLLTQLAAIDDESVAEPAPARLKSRIYSALVNRIAESGPLRSLPDCQGAGQRLCVFEQALTVMPGERLPSANPCRICHARVLGERLEWAPIFWPGCPYSEFHNP
jgi:hypothetical protein